ncbi:MAG: hypothetical protein KIT18_00515 [Burkholderiales bacterium]|nr:hypothetical protein [Burkholderiales bacterium]
MKRSTILAAWLGAVMTCSLDVAPAQTLNDPTRPPPGYADAEPAGGAQRAGPVLQSVIITPSSRSAIISGETVRLGGRYGNARLVKVSENEVVLKDGDETLVLKLYPDVDMRSAVQTGKSTPQRVRPGTK